MIQSLARMRETEQSNSKLLTFARYLELLAVSRPNINGQSSSR